MGMSLRLRRDQVRFGAGLDNRPHEILRMPPKRTRGKRLDRAKVRQAHCCSPCRGTEKQLCGLGVPLRLRENFLCKRKCSNKRENAVLRMPPATRLNRATVREGHCCSPYRGTAKRLRGLGMSLRLRRGQVRCGARLKKRPHEILRMPPATRLNRATVRQTHRASPHFGTPREACHLGMLL